MNGLVFLCQLVLVCLSYSPYVRGTERGEIHDLEYAKIYTYNSSNIFDLEAAERYPRQENARLRYDGGQSYTIFADDDEIEFNVKEIFIVVRDIVGIVAEHGDRNVLLRFKNEQNARDLCKERYDFTSYSDSNDFEVDTVLVLDDMSGDWIQKTILNEAAINIKKLKSTSERRNHHRFVIHPTGSGPKPPVALFTANSIGIRRGNKSNYLALQHKVGSGAFYFGLIFPSHVNANKFLQFVTKEGIAKDMRNAEMSDHIVEELFKNY